jgi:transitional endoplasmic reticulum ATPase
MAERRTLGDASLTTSAEKGDASTLEIKRSKVKKILLEIPEGMTLKELATQIIRKDEEENQLFAINYNVKGYHLLDVAVNFHRALADIFGWTNMMAPRDFFSRPPTLLSVETGLDEETGLLEVTQVPWGKVQIPQLEGFLETGMNPNASPPHFILQGQIKFKYKNVIDEIMAVTRKFLRTQSIYRGKAVKVSWAWERQGQSYDLVNHAPKFVDLSGHTVEDLILPAETIRELDLTLFTPIRYYHELKANNVPIKGGVLLEGPFGTGKSLAAKVAGKLAVDKGWTFIELDNIQDLEPALRFAEFYGPAVLAGEDIDLVIENNEMSLSNIRNLMDGVDTKSHEIITILTTNHLDKITAKDDGQSLLRYGRLSVVSIPTPDAEAAERLVRKYGLGLFHPSADFKRMGEALQGINAAGIQGAVEQAKGLAISRIGSQEIKGLVMEDDVITVAKNAKNRSELIARKKKRVPRSFKFVVPSKTVGRYAFVDQDESHDGDDE